VHRGELVKSGCVFLGKRKGGKFPPFYFTNHRYR